MNHKQSPELWWIPWYVQRWLSSPARAGMNAAQRGIYRDLLDHCYRKGGQLPASHKKLAAMALVDLTEFEDAWKVIGEEFIQFDEHHITMPVVVEIMAEQLSKHQAAVESGRKGALKRWPDTEPRRLPAGMESAPNGWQPEEPEPPTDD